MHRIRAASRTVRNPLEVLPYITPEPNVRHYPVIPATILLMFVVATRVETLSPPEPTLSSQESDEHCTALLLDNGDHGVFGGNFDHTLTDEGLVFVNRRGVVKSSINTGTTGRRAHWTSRYASVTFNLVGYEYAWGGMNEAGLMLTTMSLNETRQPDPDERPPLDNGEWVQYILDTCATVEDVIAADDRVRIMTVDHYLFGDRNGNAATIEYLNGRLVAHIGRNLPVAALANDTYASSAATWESLRASGFYSGLSSSLHRFCIAADRVAGFSPTSDAEAVAYAFETLDRVRGERFSPSPTNWSLVFDSENRRAYYRTRRNPAIRWVDLTELDPRCGPPAWMIDIHAGGPGSVSGILRDFDFEVNRQHFERFLATWGVNLSHSTIMWILDYIDDFGCVSPRRATDRRVTPNP